MGWVNRGRVVSKGGRGDTGRERVKIYLRLGEEGVLTRY